MSELKGKTALITGAATGIGRSIATTMAEAGAKLCLVDINEVGLKETAQSLPNETLSINCDVTDIDQMNAAVAKAEDRFGGVGVAVLNAGVVGTSAPVDEYPLEVFDAVMRVNVRGVWCGLQSLLPGMLARKNGAITITSSLSGVMGFHGVSAYTASKHAVIGMMRSASIEAAPFNVRVNAIAPGFIDTQMVAELEKRMNPDDPGSVRAACEDRTPLKRYADPREVANLVKFLSSDDASFCAGGVYSVDGGFAT